MGFTPTTGLTNLADTITTMDSRLRSVERTGTTISTLQSLTGAVNTRLQLVEATYATSTALTAR